MTHAATTVLHWNGEDMPSELRDLPRGRYLVVPVDAVPELTPAEDAGIERAIASLATGHGVDAGEARRIVSDRLRR